MLQKKILRSISNVPLEHPTDDLFCKIGVMKIFDLYKYRLCARYKIETNLSQCHLKNLAKLTDKIYRYPTRIKEPLEVPFFRTNYGHQSLKYTLPSTLNQLSRQGIELSNISVSILREMFISNVYFEPNCP